MGARLPSFFIQNIKKSNFSQKISHFVMIFRGYNYKEEWEMKRRFLAGNEQVTTWNSVGAPKMNIQ